jgi:hypothetical protein
MNKQTNSNFKNVVVGFPKIFEIQTASFCNGGCVICPYKDVEKNNPKGTMSDNLFKKIIDEIAEIDNYGIKIAPYFNNEPFLDKKIIERIIYINQKCPNCEIELSTNLSLLDKKCQIKLAVCKLKELRLSIFGFSKSSHERVMTGLNWCKVKANLDNLCRNKELRENIGQVSLVMIDYPGLRKKDIISAKKYCKDNFIKFEFWGFLDRAGNVEKLCNNINKKNIYGCEQHRPIERFHVLFDGRVMLCCMDWKLQYVLGDVNECSIKQIWHSSRYKAIRKSIYGNEKSAPLLCKKCKLSI